MTSSSAEVTVDTPTEWQKDRVAVFACNLCAAKHTKTSQMGKSFCGMTAYIDLTTSQRYFLQTPESYRKKKQMDRCNSQIQLTLEKLGFAVASLIFG